jgi:hypothetical protein
MLVIRDTVSIDTTASAVFCWFEHIDENYLAWHPSHVSCRYVKGQGLKEGVVIYAEEYLHGKLHKLRLYLTEVIPNKEFQYRVAPGIRGGFRLSESGEGLDVEAEIRIGWKLPFFGALADRLVSSIFSHLIEDLRQHMYEEGLNLRSLLEQGKSRT